MVEVIEQEAKITTGVRRAYRNETFVYFDIETIPDQNPGALEQALENVKPPANLKKQESIDKWLAENREQAAWDAIAKTSFDGGAGHVCTIGWAKNDGEVEVRHAESRVEEADVIREFFGSLDCYHSETLVGHNIFGFDIPFLLKRAVVLGIELPDSSAFPRDPKPWDKTIFDTMTAWAGARDRISLDRLCGILNIPGKDGFDGSMVAEAWANGEHQRIAEYCDDDVRRVRSIHRRFLAAGF